MNRCRACNEDFGSVTAFDAHRVGSHDYTDSESLRMESMREDGRRCLDADEMEARSFVRNKRGRWSISPYLTGGLIHSPVGAGAPASADMDEIAQVLR